MVPIVAARPVSAKAICPANPEAESRRAPDSPSPLTAGPSPSCPPAPPMKKLAGTESSSQPSRHLHKATRSAAPSQPTLHPAARPCEPEPCSWPPRGDTSGRRRSGTPRPERTSPGPATTRSEEPAVQEIRPRRSRATGAGRRVGLSQFLGESPQFPECRLSLHRGEVLLRAVGLTEGRPVGDLDAVVVKGGEGCPATAGPRVGEAPFSVRQNEGAGPIPGSTPNEDRSAGAPRSGRPVGGGAGQRMRARTGRLRSASPRPRCGVEPPECPSRRVGPSWRQGWTGRPRPRAAAESDARDVPVRSADRTSLPTGPSPSVGRTVFR